VTLPDGSVKDVPKGTTPYDVARGISPRLADAAFPAKAYSNNGALSGFGDPVEDGGYLIDLRRPLEQDLKLKILTDRDAEALYVFRHSAAHLLAAAVMELYPNVKLELGRRLTTDFFTSFYASSLSLRKIWEKIERRCANWRRRICPNERKLLPQGRSDRPLQENEPGFQVRACGGKKPRRPMVSFTPRENSSIFAAGRIFLRRSGFRRSSCERCGRVLEGPRRATRNCSGFMRWAFFTQKELDEYLHRLEEAKRRDHRKLGTELELFSVQEEAGPGLIFWHPKADSVRNLVEEWLRKELMARGYDLVYTPHIMRRDLWNTSGHTGYYKDNMFGAIEVEKAEYQLKPMNCPGHIFDFQIEIAELSRTSGAIGGIGNGLSLRAERRAAWIAARARIYARRRAYFLPCRRRSKRKWKRASNLLTR